MKRIYAALLFFIIVGIFASVELGYVSGKSDLFISKIELTDKKVYKNDFEERTGTFKWCGIYGYR